MTTMCEGRRGRRRSLVCGIWAACRSTTALLLTSSAVALSLAPASVLLRPVHSFSTLVRRPNTVSRRPTFLSIVAPPGSGYAGREEETSTFPATYEPMMEYPGTMRPGRTPENMPFQDLPIGDNDPDPVPWPHFQQIEWHHRWDPPHEHPIPMEDFIDQHGRWATPEMEAAMRAGVRRDVRERRQEEETDKQSYIITDDDDDELSAALNPDPEPIPLGDGVFGKLGSAADQALTAAAVDPANQGKKEDEDDDVEEDGLDDFLLDLGLDMELGDDQDSTPKAKGGDNKSDGDDTVFALDLNADDDDTDGEERVSLTASSGGDTTTTINVDEDDAIGIDDEEELEGDTIPLNDFNDDSDALDTEDIFDEGGFDFDDDFGGDMDGGDMW